MSLIYILIVVALIGFFVWILNQIEQIPANFKKIINLVALVVTVLWLLQAFGILGAIWDVRIR